MPKVSSAMAVDTPSPPMPAIIPKVPPADVLHRSRPPPPPVPLVRTPASKGAALSLPTEPLAEVEHTSMNRFKKLSAVSATSEKMPQAGESDHNGGERTCLCYARQLI